MNAVKLSMGDLTLVYGITAIIFFIIDLIWLGVVAKGLYDRHVGNLLRDNVNWIAAICFYAIYIGGIQVFAVVPTLQGGTGILHAAMLGGLLGFLAYATFDLTCLALIKHWSLTITVIDMIWGTFLTATTSALTVWLASVAMAVR